MNITEFYIDKLHGRRSVRVPLVDNKLVLVGENGSGKTTIINLLYYFLSAQWEKASRYNFESVGATINGDEVSLTKEAIASLHQSESSRYLPRSRFMMLRRELARLGPEHVQNDPYLLRDLADKYGVPFQVLITLIRELEGDPQLDLALTETADRLRAGIDSQLLYLPTYRRIEQDLKEILPELKREPGIVREQMKNRTSPNEHIELVRFGMEDVEQNVTSKMDELKDNLAKGLNNLTGTYLHEVIGGQYRAVEVKDVRSVDLSTIDSFLHRIDEKVLPEGSKESLRQLIKGIQIDEEMRDDQKIVAHFLLRLLSLYNRQQKEERTVREFVEICNRYLTGKEIVYDNNDFLLQVNLDPALYPDQEAVDSPNKVTFQMLSSGEKQIVSLFSHLMLSKGQRFFVLIDEPELSLSVPWQQQFLPDILRTGRCSGLIAVTHSPFVFENELDPYAHALTEFWV